MSPRSLRATPNLIEDRLVTAGASLPCGNNCIGRWRQLECPPQPRPSPPPRDVDRTPVTPALPAGELTLRRVGRTAPLISESSSSVLLARSRLPRLSRRCRSDAIAGILRSPSAVRCTDCSVPLFVRAHATSPCSLVVASRWATGLDRVAVDGHSEFGHGFLFDRLEA